ncbi:MAG TPA: hypothetical protein VLL52_21570 [Anaerolineae bacterium]|nr:hypothetical protein [Anaerolineae bacterium]
MNLLLVDTETKNSFRNDKYRKRFIKQTLEQISNADLTKPQTMDIVIHHWLLLSVAYEFEDIYLSCQAHLKAIELLKTTDNYVLLGRVYMHLGGLLNWASKGDSTVINEAIAYYEQAMSLFEQHDYAEFSCHILQQLAFAYGRLNNHKKARNYLYHAIHLNCQNMPLITSHLAYSFMETEEYEMAIKHFEQTLSLCEEAKTPYRWGYYIRGLAKAYEAVGDIEGAQRTLKRGSPRPDNLF